MELNPTQVSVIREVYTKLGPEGFQHLKGFMKSLKTTGKAHLNLDLTGKEFNELNKRVGVSASEYEKAAKKCPRAYADASKAHLDISARKYGEGYTYKIAGKQTDAEGLISEAYGKVSVNPEGVSVKLNSEIIPLQTKFDFEMAGSKSSISSDIFVPKFRRIISDEHLFNEIMPVRPRDIGNGIWQAEMPMVNNSRTKLNASVTAPLDDARNIVDAIKTLFWR